MVSFTQAFFFFPKIKSTSRGFPGGPVVETSSSNPGVAGLIPGWGTKIPHTSKNQNIKQKEYCNKFSKDIENGPH